MPAIELERQQIGAVAPLGIVSRGAVRSILLVSKAPVSEIKTLAADLSSRTSVVLVQLILAKRFGVRPAVIPMRPLLDRMLEEADAGLVIGDPALLIDPERSDALVVDLGTEWTAMTGLPMVYAVWAGRSGFESAAATRILQESWEYGMERIEEIVATEAPQRKIPGELARAYLTRNISFAVDGEASKGLELFRRLARDAGLA